MDKIVRNISNHQLDEYMILVLKEELNFTIASRHEPIENIICGFEAAI